MNRHEKFMHRSLQLAAHGIGDTYPNPLVGSVIVHNDTIIGEGWHRKAGEAHAEVVAIESVQRKELLKESTLYVNLEPCSHHGKTPPCADRIITEGIPKVVIGSKDKHAKVNGQGIARLRDHGVEVVEGVLEKESDEINKRFFTFHQKRRPFVILKWAQSQDGLIAPAAKLNKAPVWISNAVSRQWTHRLRAQEQAILVGTNTVLADNPSLTTRDWQGTSPIRVLIDKSLKIEKSYQVMDGNISTIVFTEKEASASKNLLYEKVAFKQQLIPTLLERLYKLEIQSLVVEGGAKTLQGFIDQGLWDEAIVFSSPTHLKNGVKAPQLDLNPIEKHHLMEDVMMVYKNLSS